MNPEPAPDTHGPVPHELVLHEPAPDVAAWQAVVAEVIARCGGLSGHRSESLPPLRAAGRVLSAEVRAPADLPPQAVSAMDGFAVRAADLHRADHHRSDPHRSDAGGLGVDDTDGSGPRGPSALTLPVAADLAAARGEVAPLAPGHAARIMTGAPLPAGADTVVEVERTDADPHGPVPETVRIAAPAAIPVGRHVRGPGEEVARGSVLASPGQRVGAGLVGLAQTLGIARLEVEPAVRVGVLVTGDELVDPSDAVAAAETGAVRESNGAMLSVLLSEVGADVEVLRSGDDVAAFSRALGELAARSDLVITSGGIGHGAYDVVKAALDPARRTASAAEPAPGCSRFAHVRLRPGGPQGAGVSAAGVPMIHLPGTPVGVLVGFSLFVRPLLDATQRSRPLTATVLGEHPAPSGPAPGRMQVLPGVLARTEEGAPAVRVAPGHRLAPYGSADCLILAPGRLPAPGHTVPVLPL